MITPNTLLLTAALLTAEAPVLTPVHQILELQESERDLLGALDTGNFDLRAAGLANPADLEAKERAALQELEESFREQAETLRAGDLSVSNHDLLTILLVIAILVGLALLF